MTATTIVNIGLLVAAMLMSAFYSGSETGFYCLNRLRVWVGAERGSGVARALMNFIRNPRATISTILVGNNIANYAATILFTEQLRHTVLGHRPDFYSSIILPPILLVFCEIIPKSVFQHHSGRLMRGAVWPLRVSAWLYSPLAWLLRAVSRIPHLLAGERQEARGSMVSQDSFKFYLSQGAAHGALSSYQRSMAENILRLGTTTLAAALTPLERAVMVRYDASFEDLREVLAGHRYSRVPVWRSSRDDIVGVINVIDVASAEGSPSASELMRDVLVLEEQTSVAQALTRMRGAKQQFAVVRDGDGRAVGVVTIKDLVEEIVGELEAW